MKKTPRRTEPPKPVFKRESPTREIAFVPLPDGQFAELYADDYREMMEKGVSPFWSHNPNGQGTKRYVRYKSTSRKNNGTIAWHVLGVWQKHKLRLSYVDDNPLNLRRDNLRISQKWPGA